MGIEITDSDIARLEQQEKWSFDEDRKNILKSTETFDVQACAGSGKTTLIGAKLILLAEKWQSVHQGVCVLSHTNVAKDEIINRLEIANSRKAKALLSYPHFIGTIQEFVNKFLGLPLIRSEGIDIKFIDSDACADIMYSRLPYGTKAYLTNKQIKDSSGLLSFTMKYENSGFVFNVPTFPQVSTSDSYINLLAGRRNLISEGCFFYRDIYSYSEKLLTEHPQIISKLRKRFPFILIDEMQDTQSFQDDLILKLFATGSDASTIQRFGDPDQSIFNEMDGESANTTYNNKPATQMFSGKAIDTSNRFLNSVANKVQGLSVNKVLTQSCLNDQKITKYHSENTNTSDFSHTIFIYDDATITNVIPNFAELVSGEFVDKTNKIVKVVGANGSETSTFTIKNYWPSYSKRKNIKNFKAEALIDSVYSIKQNQLGDVTNSIKMLKQAVLDYLRKSDQKDSSGHFFNAATLEKNLTEIGKFDAYKKLVFDLINDTSEITETSWNTLTERLREILSITQTHSYLNFRVKSVADDTNREEETNVTVVNDIPIEVSTIHAVKGETHHATLVLDTKNRTHDLHSLLPWLLDKTKALPTQDTKLKFMRQLYVAMTRPMHLLCLAIHKDRITDAQINQLGAAPHHWKIKKLF
jgi:DNA helicase-2/ATP-dependent DNA helicase PcrA